GSTALPLCPRPTRPSNEGNNAFNQAGPPPINFSYHLGVDGLSVWLIALAGLLFLIGAVVLSRKEERLRSFAVLMLLSEAGVIGVLTSLDLVLFYFFWEAALIPLYFLMIGWGTGDGRSRRSSSSSTPSPAACSCCWRSSGCTLSPVRRRGSTPLMCPL
ncbi:proton-translocating NADH-quinone oxidoreductase, chain M, partial [mine drainage metagenome]